MENLNIDTETLKGEMHVNLDFDDDNENEREECVVKFTPDGYMMYGQDLKHKLRVEFTLRIRSKEHAVYIYNRGNTRLDITDAVKERIAKAILDAWEQRLLTEADYLKKAQIEHFSEKIKENENEIKNNQESIDQLEADNRKYQRVIDDIECGI